jgi:hypothetical protein
MVVGQIYTLASLPPEKNPSVLLRWVHTCNVTAYRNAVTLQLTDTKRSYGLNFRPVPHGVALSCERTSGGSQFVSGARAMSLRLAAASYIYIH